MQEGISTFCGIEVFDLTFSIPIPSCPFLLVPNVKTLPSLSKHTL